MRWRERGRGRECNGMCNGGAAAGKDRISEDDVVVIRAAMVITNIGLKDTARPMIFGMFQKEGKKS